MRLFYNTQIEEYVHLKPNQIVPTYLDHLLRNAKDKFENRFNNEIFIIKVNSIVRVISNIIDSDSPERSIIFHLIMGVLACNLSEDMEITAQVAHYVHGFMLCLIHPVKVAIRIKDLDMENFMEDGEFIYKLNDTDEDSPQSRLMEGEFVRVVVLNFKEFPEKSEILCMARLLRMADAEEIEEFKMRDTTEEYV